MSIKEKRVLVTGARAPVALHLCRMLKESGHDVYAADSITYALTKVSNSIEEFFTYPAPKWRTEEFISFLITIIQKKNIDLLIPTCEECFYISMFKDRLSLYCEVFVGEFQQMKLLHNKYDFIQYISRLGFSTPKTLTLTSTIGKEDVQAYFEDRIVLKKIYSRFSDSVIFLDKHEYEPMNSSWIAQEVIEGMQYCSYSIAKEGKLLGHSVYQSVFTAGIGASIAIRYEERKDIEALVRCVVEDLNFTGQISFDFIVDQSGVAIPIECNPRATSGVHLFHRDVAECFVGEVVDTIVPEKAAKRAMTLAMLVYAISNLKKTKNIPQWFNTIFSYEDFIWSKQDMKPFFYQFKSMYVFWKDSKEHHRTLSEQSTADMSWDGEVL